VITSYDKFFSGDLCRLYMMAKGNTVYGLLKVGKKNLFVRNAMHQLKEIKPLCVLDFYVHESC
jgi:alpha-tubulin N-acetyltransferase 1